jgi:hypothetical protein
MHIEPQAQYEKSTKIVQAIKRQAGVLIRGRLVFVPAARF